MLIILGGLPGVGKTSIARLLAQRLAAVHIRVDTIEQALRSSNALVADIGPAGYMVTYSVAEDSLRVGRIVLADSVNPLKVTRDAWVSVAKRAAAKAVEIEIICSDSVEHRRRIETRPSDIEGFELPTWEDVIGREYDAWERLPIVVDTAVKSMDENVTALIQRLGFRDSRRPDPDMFRALEEQLLDNTVRRSSETLNMLLADEFVEFGSSGVIYGRQEVVDALSSEPSEGNSPLRSAHDFKMSSLSHDTVLVTYRSVRKYPGTDRDFRALRSSIWRLIDGQWQMFFHQCTSTQTT